MSSLGRARGLGSAKHGVHHWIVQRVSAIALIPLTIWFVIQAPALFTFDYLGFLLWIKSTVNALLLASFISIALFHGIIGVQVVIEDYVHSKCWKIKLLVFLKLITYAAIALTIFSIFSLYVKG